MSLWAPTERQGRVMRIATIAVFVVAAALAVRALTIIDRPDRQEIEVRRGELSVDEAIRAPGVGPYTVRGWLFNDGNIGFRLCHARRSGSPPTCIGPFISLLSF